MRIAGSNILSEWWSFSLQKFRYNLKEMTSDVLAIEISFYRSFPKGLLLFLKKEQARKKYEF